MFERVCPPSTLTQAPVTQEARSEARKTTTAATSSRPAEATHGYVGLDERLHALGVLLQAPSPRATWEGGRARRHRVDADVVAGQGQGHALGVADHGRLHGVVGDGAAGLATPDGGDVDDAAAAGPPHVRHDRPRGPHGGQDVGLVDRVPGLVLVARPGAADVVHQHVDAPEGGGRLRHQPVDVLALRQVGHHAEGADALRPHLGLGLAQALLAAGAEGDVTALLGQGKGDGAPDAAAGAGDDGRLVLQAEIHGRTFRMGWHHSSIGDRDIRQRMGNGLEVRDHHAPCQTGSGSYRR